MSWSSTTSTPTYWTGGRPRETHRLRTSPTEVLHLGVAFAVLTTDFALVWAALGLGSFMFPSTTAQWELLIGAAATAGVTGFLLHELAHKIVAQRRGLWAEFRASPVGLVFSMLTAYFGFLFAAPGATVVDGFGDMTDWGLISVAGPLVNITAGLGFLGGFWILLSRDPGAQLTGAFGLLAFVNAWFGTFNLIPVGPLDGAKIFRWNKGVWVSTIALSGVLTVVVFWLLSFA